MDRNFYDIGDLQHFTLKLKIEMCTFHNNLEHEKNSIFSSHCRKKLSTVEVKEDKILGEKSFLFLLFHLNKSSTSTALLILCINNRKQKRESLRAQILENLAWPTSVLHTRISSLKYRKLQLASIGAKEKNRDHSHLNKELKKVTINKHINIYIHLCILWRHNRKICP